MTPVHSNIFLFPSPPTFQLDFVQREERDYRLAKLNSLDPDERADYVASILRPVIRIAKQKGKGLQSLPPQLPAGCSIFAMPETRPAAWSRTG